MLLVAGTVQSKNVSLVLLTFLTATAYCQENIPFRSLSNITSNLTFRKLAKYAPFPDPVTLVCLENTTRKT